MSDEHVIKRKGFAYITYQATEQTRLLVFEQPDSPEAGIQVPAGTLKPDETPQAGTLREAIEETGLTALTVIRFLGEQQRDMSDFPSKVGEVHHRYFYHLRCDVADPSDTWLHGERFPSDEGNPATSTGEFRHRFQFYWVTLPHGVPDLIADHDFYVDALVNHLRNAGNLA